MSTTLAEIPVAKADANTTLIYNTIMRQMGVGSPALIYRHLAAVPGLLDWTWTAIGPEIENGWIVPAAIDATEHTDTLRLPKVSDEDLRTCSVTADDHRAIDNILNTYNRMNPVNLCLITALREILSNATPGGVNREMPSNRYEAPASDALPTPLVLQDMPEDLRATILALSDAIPSENGRVIPTLYRHLAIWPDLLRQLAPSLLIEIENGHVASAMDDVSQAVTPLIAEIKDRAAKRINSRVPVQDVKGLSATLDSFLFTIPQLIVIGRSLRKALPHAA